MNNHEVRHEHWIIGDWHISVDRIDGLWAWRVDDLNLTRDPLKLTGEGLPSLETAVLLALNAAARMSAVYASGGALPAEAQAIELDREVPTFEDVFSLEWLDGSALPPGHERDASGDHLLGED